jgi:hypothetical protein
VTRSHSNVVFDEPVRQRRVLPDIVGMLFCVLSGLVTAAALWLFLL